MHHRKSIESRTKIEHLNTKQNYWKKKQCFLFIFFLLIWYDGTEESYELIILKTNQLSKVLKDWKISLYNQWNIPTHSHRNIKPKQKCRHRYPTRYPLTLLPLEFIASSLHVTIYLENIHHYAHNKVKHTKLLFISFSCIRYNYMHSSIIWSIENNKRTNKFGSVQSVTSLNTESRSRTFGCSD